MPSPRRIVELLARGRSFRRRLPADFGGVPIQVSPDAALRWLKPGNDAFEAQILHGARMFAEPGAVVWDIGANVGVFGVAAATITRAPAILIEADDFLCTLLRRTQRLGAAHGLDLRPLCVAVADRDGCVQFSVAGRGRAANGLADVEKSTQHGAPRELMLVPTLSADTLLEALPAPAIVKVDVEGAEVLFLRGATRLMAEVRPVILIELFQPQKAEAHALCAAQRYRIYKQAGPRLVPADDAFDTENHVALPEESIARYAGLMEPQR